MIRQKKSEPQLITNQNANVNPTSQGTLPTNVQTQVQTKENVKKQKKTESNKKPQTVQFSTPKNTSTMQKLFSQTMNNTGNANVNAPPESKTVFTKLSEELFTKFVSNKDNQNKKTSAYDYLINDMFLNRMCEKTDMKMALNLILSLQETKNFRTKNI